MAYIASAKPSHQLSLIKLASRFLAGSWNARRMARDRRILARLPSDRLSDVGLRNFADATSRSSGEAGDIPRADLW